MKHSFAPKIMWFYPVLPLVGSVVITYMAIGVNLTSVSIATVILIISFLVTLWIARGHAHALKQARESTLIECKQKYMTDAE